MDMIAIIISYPSLGFFVVSTLVHIFCRRHYYFIYDHRLLFVVGLMFSRSLTYYSIVDMLMWYLTDHKVSFVRSTALSNIQGSLSSLFVIFMAHSADSFVGRFRTLLFSTTAFISGVMLLLMFNPYDVTWLIVIVIVLLALGKSGDTLLENVFTDLVDEVDKSEGRNKKRSHARARFWRRVAHVSGSIFATMWVTPDALGGIHSSYNISFFTCLISMTVTLVIFCKGHSVYHQGELIDRPIRIFFRVIRTRLQKLLRAKSRCSTQERSLERRSGNEGITDERLPQDQVDNCYKEDVKVIRSLLRIFPLWGTFLVVSLISAVGNTFYYEQFDNLEYSYKIPVQIYFVIQELSCFAIPILYQWTRFRHNQKLQIGVGMLCSFLSCVFAWQQEVNRLKEIRKLGVGDGQYIETSISFLWLVPQFVMLGCMEGLTEKGMLKFFTSQVDKPVQNFGEEYMKIVICLGQLLNTSLMLILRRRFGWFHEGANDETRLDKYYKILVYVCSVNLIVYSCVAIWFYKDTKQDHNSSHDYLHQHDDGLIVYSRVTGRGSVSKWVTDSTRVIWMVIKSLLFS